MKENGSAETASGRIVREIFRRDDFVIARVYGTRPKKEFTVLGEGKLEPQKAYEFHGKWEHSNRYNEDQFKFDLAVLERPMGREAVLNYLIKLPHVGPKTALKIWDEYGEDCFRALQEDFAAVSEKIGVSVGKLERAAKAIKDDEVNRRVRIELHSLLDKNGFPKTLVETVIKEWGGDAIDVLRRDPFKLMRFQRVGFEKTDAFYLSLGLNPKRLKRRAYAVIHAMQSDRTGSTWFSDELIRAAVVERFGTSARAGRVREFLLRSRVLATRTVDGERFFARHPHSQSEVAIAQLVKKMGAGPGKRCWGFRSLVNSEAMTPHQIEQLSAATAGMIGLLCGGAGVGKTFVIAELVKVIVKKHGPHSLAIAAPTGKAAVRATESIAVPGIQASTIHSLLQARPSKNGWQFHHNANNPLFEDFIIIDETSMLDLFLAKALLAAVRPGARILFVGDDHQLPSVDTGSVLRDFIASRLPCGRLSETHRNAGTIAAIADETRRGVTWKLPAPSELDLKEGRNLACKHVSMEQLPGLLERLLKIALNEGDDPIWDLQVVCYKNDTRQRLNGFLQSLLNPNGFTVKDNPFRVGDKITKKPGKQSYDSIDNAGSIEVPNGEFGEVTSISETTTTVRLIRPESSRVLVRGKQIHGWELAYCATCHKMQGSETPIAAVIVEPGCSFTLDRSWLYTAITRAKRLCFCIGDLRQLPKLIQSSQTVTAKTFLAELIRGDLS